MNSLPAPLEALRELEAAIEKKWMGESERRRSNALSPRIEEALETARAVLDAATEESITETR